MKQNLNLSSENGDLYSDPSQYRRLIGRLIYLTITRPEITYSLHVLSQHMQTPRQKKHWKAAIRVLHNLKSSLGQGIILPNDNDLHLVGYCDSNSATSPITHR